MSQGKRPLPFRGGDVPNTTLSLQTKFFYIEPIAGTSHSDGTPHIRVCFDGVCSEISDGVCSEISYETIEELDVNGVKYPIKDVQVLPELEWPYPSSFIYCEVTTMLGKLEVKWLCKLYAQFAEHQNVVIKPILSPIVNRGYAEIIPQKKSYGLQKEPYINVLVRPISFKREKDKPSYAVCKSDYCYIIKINQWGKVFISGPQRNGLEASVGNETPFLSMSALAKKRVLKPPRIH